MKASEVKRGMVLLGEEGEVVYTVLDVNHVDNRVDALVQVTVDGGSDVRSWYADTEVPLVNPAVPS